MIPGLGRSSGGRHSNPVQYSCREHPHGRRSQVGYSPWGSKEWDTTERLSTQQGQYGQRGQKSLDKREERKFQQV